MWLNDSSSVRLRVPIPNHVEPYDFVRTFTRDRRTACMLKRKLAVSRRVLQSRFFSLDDLTQATTARSFPTTSVFGAFAVLRGTITPTISRRCTANGGKPDISEAQTPLEMAKAKSSITTTRKSDSDRTPHTPPITPSLTMSCAQRSGSVTINALGFTDFQRRTFHLAEKSANEMVRRLILPPLREDRGGSF